jgi:hypothetical protein
LLILLQSLVAVGGALREGEFQFLEPELDRLLDVVARAIAGDALPADPVQDPIDGRAQRLADDVPKGVIDRTDGVDREAFSPVVERAAPHDVP